MKGTNRTVAPLGYEVRELTMGVQAGMWIAAGPKIRGFDGTDGTDSNVDGKMFFGLWRFLICAKCDCLQPSSSYNLYYLYLFLSLSLSLPVSLSHLQSEHPKRSETKALIFAIISVVVILPSVPAVGRSC